MDRIKKGLRDGLFFVIGLSIATIAIFLFLYTTKH